MYVRILPSQFRFLIFIFWSVNLRWNQQIKKDTEAHIASVNCNSFNNDHDGDGDDDDVSDDGDGGGDVITIVLVFIVVAGVVVVV